MRRSVVRGASYLLCTFITYNLSPVTVFSAQWPSLFRGVVVADSQVGVRVVSVDESSQAYGADLRPEDVIVSVGGEEIHSIDEFATISAHLKGRQARAMLTVFRQGVPREILLHLYSYPVLRAWGLEFVPDHDVRFASPEVGLAYWARLGRGFEEAGKPQQAVEAYLNGLHNVPTDVASATKAAELLARLGQDGLRQGSTAEGIARLRQSVTLLERLFDQPLSEEQLQRIKGQLEHTIETLRRLRLVSQTSV